MRLVADHFSFSLFLEFILCIIRAYKLQNAEKILVKSIW